VAAAFEHTWASLTVAGRSLVASIVLRLDMRIPNPIEREE
jgi:hypothetical protein